MEWNFICLELYYISEEIRISKEIRKDIRKNIVHLTDEDTDDI